MVTDGRFGRIPELEDIIGSVFGREGTAREVSGYGDVSVCDEGGTHEIECVSYTEIREKLTETK